MVVIEWLVLLIFRTRSNNKSLYQYILDDPIFNDRKTLLTVHTFPSYSDGLAKKLLKDEEISKKK